MGSRAVVRALVVLARRVRSRAAVEMVGVGGSADGLVEREAEVRWLREGGREAMGGEVGLLGLAGGAVGMDWRRGLGFVLVVGGMGFLGSVGGGAGGVDVTEEERPAAARGMEVVVVVVVVVVVARTGTGAGVASFRFLGDRLVGEIGGSVGSGWVSSCFGVVSRLRFADLANSLPFDFVDLTTTLSSTSSFRGPNRLLITLPTAPSLVAACSASIAA